MAKVCVYGLCKSKSDLDTSEWCIDTDGVKFIRFPQLKWNKKRCHEWVQACGRSDFSSKNVNNFTWICSKHFPLEANLDFRANKELTPFPHTGDLVSRKSQTNRAHSIGSQGQKTYGRQLRKTVAVEVPVLSTSTKSSSSTSTLTASIELPEGDDGKCNK